MDDWFDPTMATYIKKVIKDNPGVGFKYEDVKNTGEEWDVSTEKKGAGKKPRGTLPAKFAVAALGVYIKAQENMLRKVLENKGLDGALDRLSKEMYFTVLRLTVNAGVGHGVQLVKKLDEGGDIPRTGKTTRDPSNAARTAVLHMARAVHLSQTVFGRPYEAAQPTGNE
jgi:hypothetical protein